MSVANLALQRDKYKHLSDDEWRWFLQQEGGRERTADKLPTFAAIADWWYPVRLSCEQCSSELTARYKAEILTPYTIHPTPSSFVDLTGGYGVDTYFLSAAFAHTDYVEQNAELCRIAKHNFSNKPIAIHNTSAEEFLSSLSGEVRKGYDLIFLDPARRDSHGGKVFRLEDCTPNVEKMLPTLLAHLSSDGHILLKLSPMLDLTQAVKELSAINWDIHIVAIKNEVKELLFLSGGTGKITAIDLAKKEQVFVFTREEEMQTNSLPLREGLEVGSFLYEPNAAILKGGAYKLVAERFGLQKLDTNTHLYCSDTLVADFPGRIWRIKPASDLPRQANILVRNYPLAPEQLKKKYRLKDGGDVYLIGCRVNGKPSLFLAERL